MKDLTGERVIVVGAGIAGLTAAFRLKQRGCDVTVLERNSYVGGRMSTVRRGDYLVDVAASILPTSYTQMAALIADAGLADQVQPTNDLIGVLRDGHVHRLHGLGPLEVVKTRLLGMRSKLGLARAFLDLREYRNQAYWHDLSLAHSSDTESAAEYARRLLPEEVIDYLVDPLCRDLFLVGSNEVSRVDFLFLLGAMMGTSFFNSPRGIGFLAEGLAAQLDVRLSATVNAVEEHAKGVTVEWARDGESAHVEHASAVIVAIPAPSVPEICPQLSRDQVGFLRSVFYARSLVVSFGLARRPAEPAMWLHLPGGKKATDLICLILEHNKAPGRVPEGHGMVTTYWVQSWSQSRWDDDDERIGKIAVGAAEAVLPDMSDDVDMMYVRRVNPGVAVRPVGGLRSLREFVSSFSPHSRVQLAGDYFSSSCTNASLCSGETAVTNIVRQLARKSAVA